MLLGLPLLLAAQNPVAVESAGGESKASSTAVSSAAETFYQLQLLQQEVAELHGKVEQLNHQLAEMKRLQENRYLDLDARLQTLSGSQPATTNVGIVADTKGSDETQSLPASASTEDGLYESALSRVRIRDYDGAIADLNRLLEKYPDGSFAPNAYYWLGEIHAAKPSPDYENARRALAQVIQFFPDHRKVPDAAFKLGKVYHLMGDCERAGELLENVVEKYPGTSVARLAAEYQRDKLTCQ
ncbi:MAG: tol-pal system protein YbgF [Gammaproteobacteria bacterium]|nr:tol-pal system protein YbgF [Gammaproteobacteria bacterium]